MRLTVLTFLILTISSLAAQADGEFFQVSPMMDYPGPDNPNRKVDRIKFFNYVGDHTPDFLGSGWAFPEKGALLGMENDGAGNFSKLPDESIGGARMHTVRDFDIFDANGDGRLDIVLASEGTDQAIQPEPGDQSRLLIQKPGGGLEDVTNEKFPLGNHVVHSMTAGDIDGDGDIDLYMGHVNWCATCLPGGRLYLNDGTGKFTMTKQGLPDYVSDASQAEVGIGSIITSTFLDADGDGDLDLFLGTEDFSRFGATPPERDILLLNDGLGSFLEDASQNLPLRPFDRIKEPTAEASEAVDLDCDGDQDLMVFYSAQGEGQELQVWINDGTGHFTDSTDQWLGEELADRHMIFARPTDLNGDGWIDIALVGRQSRILINVEGDHLVDVTAELGDLANQEFWTLHPDDLDGDGDIDLFIHMFDSGYAIATNLKPLMPSKRRCNLDIISRDGFEDQNN